VKTLDVVIPVYNSEKTIGALLASILDQERLKSYNLGIILVNDGSKDTSLKVCEQFADRNSNIIVIDLMKNYGQHSAIFAGISYSKADILVTMDDDGQHSPESISLLLDSLTSEVDVVYGIAQEDEHSWLRNLTSRIFKSLAFRSLGIKNSKKTSAFRAIRAEVLRGIELNNLSSGILEVVINWNTNRIRDIKVPMTSRKTGKSNYTYYGLIRFAVAMLTSYSTRPLRIASFLGFLGFIFSLNLALFYALLAYRGDIKVEGFATLAILISFLSSLQLITLGIIGEYLGKVHERNNGKPLFVVRSAKNYIGA